MIYLDHHATTPIDPRIFKAMLPYLKNTYGNPSSMTHKFGWDAHHAIETAREKVAKLINCNPDNIIFTSGTTESNNTILRQDYFSDIVTSTIEHSSITKVCSRLAENKNIIRVGANKDGVISTQQVIREINHSKKQLVSIMLVNNEIGTIQDVYILRQLLGYNSVIHSDIAQALGRINVDVKKLGIDFASFSAHKMYGPKGVGAIYTNKNYELNPLIYGGGQEWDYRSGTQNVPAIVGFGKACEIISKEFDHITSILLFNEDYFWHSLRKNLPSVRRNCFGPKVPGSLSIILPCDNMSYLFGVIGKKVAISTSSACMSSYGLSEVLKEVGVDDSDNARSVRICVGRFNTLRELRKAAKIIARAVEHVNKENRK